MCSTNACRNQVPEALATQAPWAVERLYEREVDDTLAVRTAPPAEISILEEEEEAFVEAIECCEKCSRNEEASPHHPINILYFIAIGREHEVSVESFIEYFSCNTAP